MFTCLHVLPCGVKGAEASLVWQAGKRVCVRADIHAYVTRIALPPRTSDSLPNPALFVWPQEKG